ncbi:ankyrin repeat-containing domain protein [Apodospora peruviana]|uniref:Ankyrin repeat-containing domain protein n=1 Tax=Apodospora peruviana TaxID=516989 RepID=A0AAE0ISG7_9PEZI|nr:ankyrin repeat-containing domain protein [Apodospora peruviana]
METNVQDHVPAYTEFDQGQSITDSIDILRERANNLQLPITQYPKRFRNVRVRHPGPVYLVDGVDVDNLNVTDQTKHNDQTQADIVDALFRAVRTKNDELVSLLVKEGLVSPDVPNGVGETPLIAAVDAGNGAMVCALIALGATVDLFARWHNQTDNNEAAVLREFYHYGDWDDGVTEKPLRTPLMVAAAKGNLALAKLLIEDFGAKDALVANDGQLALRLAADSGHRELVSYLPARRGGAWRRWKVHHAVATRRIKTAVRGLWAVVKFFVWHLPKFLVWSVPKHVVVLPIKNSAVYAWKNKKHFGGWCGRQVKELPGRLKRGAQSVWREAKDMPRIAKEILQELWKVVKRIPGAIKILGQWIWEGLKKAGNALKSVFLGIVSVLHTAVMAVLDFFRTITLKDVWHGVTAVFRAVFVDFPKAVWDGIKKFGEVSYNVMKQLFGCTGEVLWWICSALVDCAVYVPVQFGRILAAMGSSIAKAYHEIMVWLNPKH